jgi:hypothetical protein
MTVTHNPRQPCAQCGNQFWDQIDGVCFTCITLPLMAPSERRRCVDEVVADRREHPERWAESKEG